MMAQDTANNGLMTLTEQSRNSQLKEEAERCKTELLTLRGLFQGSILRFKKSIQNFHWSEENGLSTYKLSLEIGESYDKLRLELVQLINEWSRFIRMAVILKDPQPKTPADREILKQEISEENRKMEEYKEMVDQLKFENIDVFQKVEYNSKFLQETQGQFKENKLKKLSSDPTH